PVEDAGLHRPEPGLHVREHLVLHVADGERHHEEDDQHHERLDHEREPVVRDVAIHHGRLGEEHHSSSSSSPSTAPGQGLASRLIRAKSFRSGWPSNGSDSSSLTGRGWPSTAIPNISISSRSCQSAVGNRSLIVGTDGSSCGRRTLSRTLCLFVVENSCVTTSNPPSSPKSTPPVKSQKSQPNSGSSRQNRTASWYRATGTMATASPNASATSTSSPKRARSRDPRSSGNSR